MASKQAARKPSAAHTDTSTLRARLIRWYDDNQRDLPWRRSRDPYAIWVSEVMLQQTRVDTVVRYYDRFLARFPTPSALASAAEDEVLALWSGLGYYRRARLLHQGVREVVARYEGRVPEDAQQRRELPGIGRYTAGAIGSIAFDRAEPIVDGNVARVLCRLRGIDSPLGRADTERQLWEEAQRWVEGERPGALNQALMELGATVCSPRNPQCDRCPLQAGCDAHQTQRTESLPVARAKPAPKLVAWVALLASPDQDAEAVWLVRGGDALFGGLWNLPMAEGTGRVCAASLAETLGLSGTMGSRSLSTVEHVLTHRRMRVQLWRLAEAQSDGRPELRRVGIDALNELGVSKLTRKLLGAGRSKTHARGRQSVGRQR